MWNDFFKYGNGHINEFRFLGNNSNSTAGVGNYRNSGNGNGYRDNSGIFICNGSIRESFGNGQTSEEQDAANG